MYYLFTFFPVVYVVVSIFKKIWYILNLKMMKKMKEWKRKKLKIKSKRTNHNYRPLNWIVLATFFIRIYKNTEN